MVADNFKQLEFRKKVADAILETLACLPEAQRHIFTWKHYCGYEAKRIAEILGTSLSEIEATHSINSVLYQKTRHLIEEASQIDAEMDLHARTELALEKRQQNIDA